MAGRQRHTLAQAAQFDRACPRGGYLNMTWVTMSARKKYITQNQKYPVYTCRQASSSQYDTIGLARTKAWTRYGRICSCSREPSHEEAMPGVLSAPRPSQL